MKITNSNKIFLSVFLALWILSGIWLVSKAHATTQDDLDSKDAAYRKQRVLIELLYTLQREYVDDIKFEDLIDAAIDGVLSEVDPHTTYFDDNDFDDFQTDTKGEFGGLGLSIDKQGDYITVVSPIEGSPAYKLGIQAGDRIIKVDGESIVGIKTDDAIRRMRGPKGTKVQITIDRPSVKNELVFDVVRDLIRVKSVPYAFKTDAGIGYVRIRKYSAGTAGELREALAKLEAEGIRGLLIDLRFNPGGLLSEAVDTVNEFIGPNKRVVFTKGRKPEYDQEYFTQYDRIHSGYPIIVLIDRGTASAAEIFAGSIQDYDKGLVVGETSFGKGSVQQVFPLSEGGVKVTVSKYYINSGRCIHKDINDLLLKGESVSEIERQDVEERNHREIFKTEKGRTVYGGGGITPDIEMPIQRLTPLASRIRQQNSMFDFSVDYVAEHDKDITERFQADDKLVNQYLVFAKDKGLDYTNAELDSTRVWLTANLQKAVVEKKFGEEAGFVSGMRADTQLQEALELFVKYPTLDAMLKHSEAIREKEERQ